ERLHDDADEVVGDVDDDALLWLEFAAVFVANDDFGLADHELEAFAAHGFDEDGELEFAAAEHAERLGRVGGFHANGDVGEQLFLQAVAEVAGGEIATFAARERAGVDGEDHGQRGLIDDQGFQRHGAVELDDAFADLDAFDSGDRDDIARRDSFGFVALEAAEGEELGDAGRVDLAAELADADFGAAIERAIEHAADGDSAEELA